MTPLQRFVHEPISDRPAAFGISYDNTYAAAKGCICDQVPQSVIDFLTSVSMAALDGLEDTPFEGLGDCKDT